MIKKCKAREKLWTSTNIWTFPRMYPNPSELINSFDTKVNLSSIKSYKQLYEAKIMIRVLWYNSQKNCMSFYFYLLSMPRWLHLKLPLNQSAFRFSKSFPKTVLYHKFSRSLIFLHQLFTISYPSRLSICSHFYQE